MQGTCFETNIQISKIALKYLRIQIFVKYSNIRLTLIRFIDYVCNGETEISAIYERLVKNNGGDSTGKCWAQ